MRTIIFFCKYLGYSGSEMLLLTLVNELARDERLKIVVVGYTDGPLLSEFHKRISYISFPEHRRKQSSFLKRQKRRVFKVGREDIESLFLDKLISNYPKAIWILNSLAMVSPIRFIENNGIASLIWIHEMDVFYYNLTGLEIELLRRVPKKYICVSNIVASFVENLDPVGEIKVIYPGKFSRNGFPQIALPKREAGKLIIGMSGNIDVNKNPIYLINFAKYLKRKNETRFKLLWIGGEKSNGMFVYMNYVIKQNNLEELIQFTGFQRERYWDYIQQLDLFLLTSYVDSFPLVMLDASAFGIPVVGWDSGGISEFVNSNSIGEILPERSFGTLFKFLDSWAKGERVFDKGAITDRSKEFSKERFVDGFKVAINFP